MKQDNRVTGALKEGRVAYGFNLIFPSAHVVEILGMLDFDFVWLDGEHGPSPWKTSKTSAERRTQPA
jgi:2-keto-3-deoxy-L-rhamnonate aldolase RhmA